MKTTPTQRIEFPEIVKLQSRKNLQHLKTDGLKIVGALQRVTRMALTQWKYLLMIN